MQEAGNDSTITSDGALALQAGETLYAGNNLTVQTNGDVTSNGTLAALNRLSLASNNLILQAGSQTTATSAYLNARQPITNQGVVSADTLNLPEGTSLTVYSKLGRLDERGGKVR